MVRPGLGRGDKERSTSAVCADGKGHSKDAEQSRCDVGVYRGEDDRDCWR